MSLFHKIIAIIEIIVIPFAIYAIWFETSNSSSTLKIIATAYLVLCMIAFIGLLFLKEKK